MAREIFLKCAPNSILCHLFYTFGLCNVSLAGRVDNFMPSVLCVCVYVLRLHQNEWMNVNVTQSPSKTKIRPAVVKHHLSVHMCEK